eukprot:scaffold16490_cov83-Skeletonema_dohrnii-CCMP3373.AAC.2
MDRDTLQVKRRIVVTRFDGTEQDDLNELELIGGLICCNIWYADEIICVDKITGRSVREYDLSTLYPREERGYHNVLNGIALGEDHLLITGKRWDRMYKNVCFRTPQLQCLQTSSRLTTSWVAGEHRKKIRGNKGLAYLFERLHEFGLMST